MTNDKPSIVINMNPRGLKRKVAAAYMGVSPTTFDEMRKDGTVAPPRKYRGNKIFDVRDLDDAYENLPTDEKPNSWDELLEEPK
jgi:hypothetical protein